MLPHGPCRSTAVLAAFRHKRNARLGAWVGSVRFRNQWDRSSSSPSRPPIEFPGRYSLGCFTLGVGGNAPRLASRTIAQCPGDAGMASNRAPARYLQENPKKVRDRAKRFPRNHIPIAEPIDHGALTKVSTLVKSLARRSRHFCAPQTIICQSDDHDGSTGGAIIVVDRLWCAA
jgi:hypothetical protein